MARSMLVVAIALVVLASCAYSGKVLVTNDYFTPLRGVVQASRSLDPDWNVDVWMGVKSRSGRPPSFVLLPQGSMEWEAADYGGFYLYAEAWRYDHDDKKIVQARIRTPKRVKVYRYGDSGGYGWNVEIRMDDDGNLYVHQRLHPSRWGWY